MMLTANVLESHVAQVSASATNEGFDYSIVSEPVAEDLRQRAELIRRGLKQTATTLIEIGQQLREAKDALGHGHLAPWLKAEFAWTERTAQSYMRVAEVFGDKTETVSILPAKLLYTLAAKSTPAEIVDDVVEQLEAGKTIDPRAVKAKIAAVRSQPLSSSDPDRCQEIRRASARAISPPDSALSGFSAIVLELIRRIKSKEVKRFAATSIAADELARAATFLAALADLKATSSSLEVSSN